MWQWTTRATVRRVSPGGIITTVAGDGVPGFSGDGGPAVSAHLNYPAGVAVDQAGNLFIADVANNRARKVAPSGIITTVAGSGIYGFSGGPATGAGLYQPLGVAVDGAGNLFIADAYNFRVRIVSSEGIITSVAGNGTRGFSTDGGPAASTPLDFPTRVAADASGNLFIADGGRIRRVSPDQLIVTVAGAPTATSSDDGGLFPIGLAADSLGNVFIAGPGSIRKVSADGIINTVAGRAPLSFVAAGGFSGDGGPAVSAQLANPAGVAVDAAGNVFIADTNNSRLRKVSTSGTITTVAGTGCPGQSFCLPLGDGGPAVSAALSPPIAVAVDRAGNLYITDAASRQIRKVSTSGIITSVAGSGTYGFSRDGGPATSAQLAFPYGVAVDSAGNLLIADQLNYRIRKVSSEGIISTVSGNGVYGSSGDGGPATSAELANPVGVAVDEADNLFIAGPGTGFDGVDFHDDPVNDRIRRVSPSGIITTVAGGGTAVSGDDGPATSVRLNGPRAVAADRAGNLFIADGNQVRKLSASGIITTIAGNGDAGFSGDGGPAMSATLNPSGLAVDGAGNVYVAESGNNAGPATSAHLQYPLGVAVDRDGNLLIADAFENRIRKVSPRGIITTVAGTGSCGGFSGDGGPAATARLNGPVAVAVDSSGSLFIAEYLNNRIRRVSPDGIIATVAGDGARGFSGDGGPATGAHLRIDCDNTVCGGVAVDSRGNVFFADAGNNRVRRISVDGIITTVAGDGSYGFSAIAQEIVHAAFRIHTALGPGLLESVYHAVLAYELAQRGLQTVSQQAIPVVYGTIRIDIGFRADRIVEDRVIVEIKSVEGYRAGSQKAASDLSAAGRQAAWPADQLQRGPDQGRHHPYRQWAGRRISRKAARTPRKPVRLPGSASCRLEVEDLASTSVSIPRGLAVDSADNLFIAEDGRVRKVSPGGTITTVAGGVAVGVARGFSGDGGLATSARLSWPVGVAVDRTGILLIADPGFNFEVGDAGDDPSVDHRIRKVSPDGIITTLAGNGSHDFSGDGGAAIAAAFDGPTGVAVDGAGNIYVADSLNGVIRILRPAISSALIGAVVDAASQRADPISPGKIVLIYGAGLGPSQLIENQAKNGQVSTELSGTTVSFNNFAAPILYSSATQVAAVVPNAVSGSAARVTVTYRGQVSADFTVPVTTTAPNVFTSNQAGWGQAAAINAVDGTINTPVNPVQIGGYISLYVAGEGQTLPAGVDGKLAASEPAHPVLPVSATVGGLQAQVQYAGGVPGQVAGLSQVNVQIPGGVQPGGYVPVILQVGDRASGTDVWIAVSN